MLKYKNYYPILLFLIFSFVFTNYATAQVDSTTTIKTDTVTIAKTDTVVAANSDKKKSKKKVDNFILYAGVNFNNLNVSSNTLESGSSTGWDLGVSYKRGNFFFWQVGARLNEAKYSLKLHGSPDSTRDDFSVAALDIPITAGINLLPISRRIFNIHAFVSAVPAFQLNVGDNTLGVKKDDTNSFIFYGQAGLGFDILFFVLDVGYNYGFNDLFKKYESKPGQVFVNLGFRF